MASGIRPDFRITADGVDVTAAITARLVELRLKDERGTSTDTLTLIIDDRPGQDGRYIEMPRKGVALDVALGYDGQLARMGSFKVDEVNPSGPPERLEISAKAADMGADMKVKRTRSMENVSLAEVVTTIAKANRLTQKVSPDLAGIVLSRIDQVDESDLNLITRIGREVGAVVKLAYGYLLMVPRGEAKTATGQLLQPVVLDKSDLSRWSATLADREDYNSVVVTWRDLDAAADVDVRAGAGDPEYRIRRQFNDAQSARLAAAAKLADLRRGTGKMSVATAGHPGLVAEAPVTLTGMRPGLNGAWEVDSAEHVLNKSGGWTVNLDLEVKK